MTETTSAWQETSLAPRERAKRLVEALTLEQKIAQLHGAMETIDISAITAQAAESGADMDQLAAQIRVERHVKAIDELDPPVPDHQRPGGCWHGRRYPEPAGHVPADDHRPGRRVRPRPGACLR